MQDAELSIVIVSYNTITDLRACLKSIFQSVQSVSYEVWVVDNASSDGSPEMIRELFPEVRLLRCERNVGFAAANNLVLEKVRSQFVLLLNPDTIMSDHVLDRTIAFLERNTSAAMASCKLVKADGHLDLACRRSFPSLFDGFCRATRLSCVFPHSHLFARYNLTYLSEDEVAEVDAVNGAFMMVRRTALEQVGLLDEQFFMYGEDLDWCYRFRKFGWKIYYVPESTVIHLKGRAGKTVSERMIPEFFRAMETFCRKHYFPGASRVRVAFTLAGIRLWFAATLLQNWVRKEKRVTP